jgi:hypothetical protein
MAFKFMHQPRQRQLLKPTQGSTLHSATSASLLKQTCSVRGGRKLGVELEIKGVISSGWHILVLTSQRPKLYILFVHGTGPGCRQVFQYLAAFPVHYWLLVNKPTSDKLWIKDLVTD